MRRIFLGNASLGFLLEVLARTAAVYLVLVFLLRLLGKRMSGQISSIELAVMVVLGAIISGAFQMPERGILPAFALMGTLLALQRGVSAAGARWVRLERWTQGGCKMLVKDGLLQLDELGRIGISHQQVFAALRGSGVQQLGEVRRLYQEVTGAFSIFRQRQPSPGLCVLPAWDPALRRRLVETERLVCTRCGALATGRSALASRCERCGHADFQAAVLAQPTSDAAHTGAAAQERHAV